ncbi:hypothetical protein AVEN_143782-1 [Araneus ventricosus]|uniref:Uncharacterized protein n=1 Tax=Araneus ventricosus TaxID=182803 RepID=A0A4Y2ANR6_ARAVE|nr:hypothetical protein AVEN_143782-1 [Araneus ventricosus]
MKVLRITNKSTDESCKSLSDFYETGEPKSFSSTSISSRSPKCLRYRIFTVKCEFKPIHHMGEPQVQYLSGEIRKSVQIQKCPDTFDHIVYLVNK